MLRRIRFDVLEYFIKSAVFYPIYTLKGLNDSQNMWKIYFRTKEKRRRK